MKKIYLLFLTLLFVLFLHSPSIALTITYNLDSSFPTKPNPDGSSPWLTAIFDDQGTTGSVLLTLNGSLTGDNFVTEWDFNLDPTLDPENLVFTLQTGYTAPTATISNQIDKFKADGDGYFDIEFLFPTPNTGADPRFNDSKTISYLITGISSLTADDFSFQSETSGGEGNWYTAAHIQSITDPAGSTWIGASNPVPEPSTMVISSLFLIGAGAFVRRKLFGKS